MAKFKVIISDPDDGTSKVLELEGARAAPLVGKRVGEVMDGSPFNLAGHQIQIMGGSDKDGFPIRPSVHGGVRRHVVLSGGVGYHPSSEGMRRRKTVRGNIISEDIVQLSVKIVERPKKTKESKEGKDAKETKKPKEKKEAPSTSAETEPAPSSPGPENG